MDLVCPSCQNSSKLGIKLSNFCLNAKAFYKVRNWNFESDGKNKTKGCRMYFVTSKSTSPKNGVVSQKMRSFERPPKMRSLKARV